MMKRKFGDSLRSKGDTAMVNEALCKILCHNLVVLIHEISRTWHRACVLGFSGSKLTRVHLRHILPIVIFWIALLGQIRAKQETPPQHKSDETHSPTPVIPAQPPAKQEQRNPAETAKKCPLPAWTDPFWSNWALVLVTGFAVWIAFGTLNDLKEQTASAKNTAVDAQQAAIFSRKATKESERADILLESISLTIGNKNWTMNGGAKIDIRFKNFGRTRANSVRLRVELTVPNVKLTKEMYEAPVMVLGVGQPYTITTDTFSDLMGMTIQLVANGQKEFRLSASAVYEDVFGDSYTTMDIGVFNPRTGAFDILQKIAG